MKELKTVSEMLLIDLPIYRSEVNVYISDNIAATKVELGLPTIHNNPNTCGYTNIDEYDNPYIIFKGVPDNATVAHETIHAVNLLFECRGIEVSTSDDENQAYHVGYIVNIIHNFIDEVNNSGTDEQVEVVHVS